MLTGHYLNQSRSQRILLALEALSLPYRIVPCQREENMLAPPALKKVHLPGKSSVVEDDGAIFAESGAILEYLQETYDADGWLRPASAAGRREYRFWLRYAEESPVSLLLM